MILNSRKMSQFLLDKSEKIYTKIQEKIVTMQQNEKCSSSKHLIYDFENLSPVDCNLGCNLHGFSAGLLCAIENDRQFTIVNYARDQFEKYFDAFTPRCLFDPQQQIAGKLGR